jgi:hypothetical protein
MIFPKTQTTNKIINPALFTNGCQHPAALNVNESNHTIIAQYCDHLIPGIGTSPHKLDVFDMSCRFGHLDGAFEHRRL